MKFLKSKGMSEVALGVDDSNSTKAIELYKKVEFKAIYKDLTYLKRLKRIT
jgi:ribosomal protein S18 acetylase RimI-like enzyme